MSPNVNTKVNATPAEVENSKREAYANFAYNEGAKYALGTLAVVSFATAAANKSFAKFNRFMSVSAKVSIPIMTAIAVGSYRFETVAHDVQLYPGRYGFGPADVVPIHHSKMPWHHRLLNHLYDHPFRIIAGLGIPFGAYILHEQMQLQHLQFSQRLLHSRVIIQFGVLSILVTTMGFKTFMDSRGRYQEPEDDQHSHDRRDHHRDH